MLYAVQLGLAAQQDRPGEPITFMIRDQTVTFDDVKHYFARKGTKDIRTLEYDSESAISTVHIAGSGHKDRIEHCLSMSRMDNRVIRLPAKASFCRNLSSSAELKSLEQTLHHGRIHFENMFSIHHPDDKISLLPKFIQEIELGGRYLEHSVSSDPLIPTNNLVSRTFKHFDSAFNTLRDFLACGSQTIFWALIYHCCSIRHVLLQEILEKLLDYTAELIHFCYPDRQLLRCSVVLLRNMSIDRRNDSAKRLLDMLMEYVDKKLQFIEAAQIVQGVAYESHGRWALTNLTMSPALFSSRAGPLPQTILETPSLLEIESRCIVRWGFDSVPIFLPVLGWISSTKAPQEPQD